MLDRLSGLSDSLYATANGLDRLNSARGTVAGGKDAVYAQADAVLAGLDALNDALAPVRAETEAAKSALAETGTVVREIRGRTQALRGLSGWMKTNGVSIPQAEQEAVRQIFSDCLERNRIALKADFAAALAEKGITMDDHRLSYHIRLAEYAGLLCSGDLFPMKHSYALVSDKLPKYNPLPKEEALALLARKYFRSHGPATLGDFVWWSGLNIGDCKAGMDAIRDELIQERWKGHTFFRHQDSRTRGFRSGAVTLLPSYDEYLIGYKSRHVAVHPDHSHRAHNNRGIFWPVVLLDGEVIGNWSVSSGMFQADIFHPEADLDDAALQAQFALYEKFLNK